MLSFHHVGIAVKDIIISSKQFNSHLCDSIVYESDIIYDQIQDAYLKIITLRDGSSMEFVSGNMVSTLLKKQVSLYHTCYESDCFDEDIALLVKKGAVPISKPSPAILFDNKRVQFFITSYGMIEILES